ncbi:MULTISPECIES: alpha/beta hydrolase [Sphingobium]|uniref:Dienelactone hydrolase n=1 Tax=Sphingobium cupriresistens LL01 TaxID=1420583 RepID=A0A0J7XV24_9SPHN|nr:MULTISPECIES: alpha/beta hydrolase [Sphingobium]KMS55596.1 dienelactone hydrolase [Sphingobium cupriresistens LL01]MBJ7377667.1 alpha/beta hydrolase [Sphingobium sp.]
MKRFVAAVALVLAVPAIAQMPTPVPAEAPADPNAIPLYPDMKAPKESTENWVRFGKDLAVRNVTVPTITPVLPDPAKATGAAVIVAPGGAFMLLAMDHEGWSVARWLADHGIAAFVLKYRLNQTPADIGEASAYMGRRMAESLRDPTAAPGITEPRATLDALAAIKLVRANADKWGVDPQRVGMIGFSAGAMTTLNAALEGKGSDRPSFIGYVYGPMLARAVPADAPPMFAAIANDDSLFPNPSYALIESWRRAHVPVELHAYERGDHGFGTGKPGTTSMGVLPQFQAWLDMRGLLNAKVAQ